MRLFNKVLVLIPLIQLFVFIIKAYLATLNKSMGDDARFHIKNISLAHHNIGVFANFKSTGYFVDT